MEEISNKIKKTGLTSFEVAKRLLKYGENSVFKKRKFRPLTAFLKKFNSQLLLILIFASLVSFFVGERINTIIILMMVLVSGILDFINTYKSELAVEKLTARVVTTATVIRDGKKQEIPLKRIVPGDAIFLSAGDIVPADCRLLETNDFFVNQSTLTGESFPLEKKVTAATAVELTLPSENAIFMGTSVITGYATALAVKTGRQTEFGKIAEALADKELGTSFEKNIRRFSFFIMQITVFLVGFVFLINALVGRGWLDSFIFGVAIAIGVTPELLPVIISVSLSRGSILMAKKKVIVKNLSAIENFGSMNVLCTDKTGTLTQDKITVVKYLDGFGHHQEDVLFYAYLNSFFHAGVKNPLDDAIKNFKTLNVSGYQKIMELPFDFSRRRQSVVVEKNRQKIIVSKGAPEDIFRVCRYCRHQERTFKLDEKLKKEINRTFEKLSLKGFKVLGLAAKKIGAAAKSKNISQKQENQMVFLGFVAFFDPPKESVQETLNELKALGLEIKILTGDNQLLTEKICQEIGLTVKGTLTGEQLAGLSDREWKKAVLKNTIFARVTPEQKEKIVLTLKAAGKTVGYLGDGINDAPALKAADVGISVNNAVDVAKETADIILLQKSLRALKDGVKEGRKTFHNTMKYIMMGLSSNFGNMFSMMAASAFLPFLPMLPTQILYNNFLYDSSQLALPGDAVDENEIKKPTAWNLASIKNYMLVFGLISSVFDFLTFGVLFFVFRLQESQFQTGWFIESIATQILVVYVIRTKKIPFIQSWPTKSLLFNTSLMVVMAWLTPFIFLGRWFGFSPLPPLIMLAIGAIVLIYLALAQTAKVFFYRRYRNA